MQPKGTNKSLTNETKKREYIEKIMQDSIVCQIREYLNNPKSASFDILHETLCTNLKECFSKEKINVTYGQAQKIVNMAFKYLYCIYYKYGNFNDAQFTDCHMPIDSFSIEWFKRCFKYDDFSNEKEALKLEEKLFKKDKNGKLLLKADLIGAWSSMDSINNTQGEKYPYEFYRDKIKAYCKERDNINSPLELDFFVWSKMKKIMEAEAFINIWGGTVEAEDKKSELEKYDIDKLEKILNNKVDKIKCLING